MTLTVTDLFAGAGGSSTGMVQIPGVRVRIAANHWPLACEIHNANHPTTDHAAVDLHQENPAFFPRTDILWASPECTKWSQANGNKLPAIDEGLFEDPLSNEAAERSRLLMFDVLRFAEYHRYRAMIIENVVDIATQVKYRTAWSEWRRQLTGLGYAFRVVSLNAMHAQAYGEPAPQSRDRIFIVCWRKGDKAPNLDRVLRPMAYCPRCGTVVESQQSWKNGRTVGKYRQQYVYVHGQCGTVVEPGWIPAAAAIDWSIPGERIGDRAKPLSPKTLKRIAAGIARYWGPIHIEASGNQYDAADPNHPQHDDPKAYYRAWSTYDVIRTLHTRETKGLAVPVGGTWDDHARDVTRDVLRTQTTNDGTGLAHMPLAVPVEGRDGKEARPVGVPGRTQTTRLETALVVPSGGTWNEDARPTSEPHRTITSRDSYAVAELPLSFVAELRGGGSDARRVTDPAATFTASGNHHALVTPYYGASTSAKPATEPVGTLTTVDRYALIHRNNGGGPEMTTPVFEPLRTLTTAGHQSLLQQSKPAVTAKDIEQAEKMLPDVLFRMFRPLEVAAGMAFPSTYDWDVRDAKGKLPTNRDLVKAMGNAVCPPCSRDLIAAVAESLLGEVAA